MNFFGELKRRSVFRMGVFYLLGSWVVLQVADVVVGVAGLPDWTLRLVGLVLLLGLPLVLVLSWVYELTPEGIKKDTTVDHTGTEVTVTPVQRLILVASFAMVMTGGYMLIDRFIVSQQQAELQNDTESNRTITESVAFAALPVEVHSDAPVTEEQRSQWQNYINMKLSLWPDIRFVRFNKVEALINSSGTPEQISEELGATHLFASKAWVEGNEVRFDFRLFDAMTNKTLWTWSFDDPFFVDGSRMDPAGIAFDFDFNQFLTEAQLSESTIETKSRSAYEAWWMARHYDNFDDPRAEKLRWYNEAIMLDPEFTKAWTDLARFWFLPSNRGTPWPEVREPAFEAINKALELDPENADANANMARILKLEAQNMPGLQMHERENLVEQSLEYARKAVQLAPRNVSIREDYARALNGKRDWSEMINQLQIIIQYRPENMYLREWITAPLVWDGRVEEAHTYLQDMKVKFPDRDWDHTEGAFTVYRARGEYLKALEAQHHMMKNSPTVWVQDYMDLLLDIGALDAVVAWSNHINELSNGQAINFVWDYILSAMRVRGETEAQMNFIDALPTSVLSVEDKAIRRLVALYSLAVTGDRGEESTESAITNIEAACDQLENTQVAAAQYILTQSTVFNAARCFVLSRRSGSNRTRLGEAVLAYFENRDPFEPSPAGALGTYDLQSIFRVYTLAAFGRVEEAVAVFREIHEQGFARPYHFRNVGVVPDLQGLYNGLGSHPEFLEMMNELEARNGAVRADIEENAPWLLNPELSSPLLEAGTQN